MTNINPNLLFNLSFWRLCLVNLSSTLALELFTITVIVIVFTQTGSALQATVAMVMRTLPVILFGPFAGVMVDRFTRKYILSITDFIRLLMIILAILLLDDGNITSLAGIYVILLVLSILEVIHRPARLAIIPSLVTPEQLIKANSFMLVSGQIVMAISFALGGWLLLVVSFGQIALGIIILFTVSILSAFFMQVPKNVTSSSIQNEHVFLSIANGWRYLLRHPLARSLTTLETMEHLPHGIWAGAVLLVFITKELPGTSIHWGLVSTFFAMGMVIGSLWAAKISDLVNRFAGRVIIANTFLTALLTLIFAGSPTVWIAIIVAGLFGPPFGIRDVAEDSLLQAKVTGGQLGRVYATREMLRTSTFMCGALLFAWIIDFIPVRSVYIIGASIYLFTGIYASTNKALRASQIIDQKS